MNSFNLPYEFPLWGTHYFVDPDFDHLGGELTLTQIEDPLPPMFDRGNDCLADRERAILAHRHYLFDHLAKRFDVTAHLHLSRARERLQRAAYLLRVRPFDLPMFHFWQNGPCNCCVPYNGHFTRDYWGTGQADCW